MVDEMGLDEAEELIDSGQYLYQPDTSDEMQALVDRFESQHPLHGMFMRAIRDEGGYELFRAYVRENPGAAIRLASTLTPSIAPIQGIQGEVVLHIHASLGGAALMQPGHEKEVNPDHGD